MRTRRALLVSFGMLTFWLTQSACKDSTNTVTGLLSTPTPVPTVTPTPLPAASLSGTVSQSGIIFPFTPYRVPGANVQVTNGGVTKQTTADVNGDFHIDGLVVGPATVTGSTVTLPIRSSTQQITLVAGQNTIDIVVGAP